MRLLILLGLVLVACGSNQLDAQRDRWKQNRPPQFVTKIQWGGSAGGCETAGVTDGFVITPSSQTPVGECYHGESGDLDPLLAMFDRVDNAGKCDVRKLSFDAQYGYIEAFYLDCGQEGWGQSVVCFHAGTTDVAVCE